MHIYRLTDNNKVVSLQKIINFEVPKFEKNIHVFLNICNTVSDNRVLQPPPPLPLTPYPAVLLRSHLVRLLFGSHLPVKKHGYGLLLCAKNARYLDEYM